MLTAQITTQKKQQKIKKKTKKKENRPSAIDSTQPSIQNLPYYTHSTPPSTFLYLSHAGASSSNNPTSHPFLISHLSHTRASYSHNPTSLPTPNQLPQNPLSTTHPLPSEPPDSNPPSPPPPPTSFETKTPFHRVPNPKPQTSQVVGPTNQPTSKSTASGRTR